MFYALIVIKCRFHGQKRGLNTFAQLSNETLVQMVTSALGARLDVIYLFRRKEVAPMRRLSVTLPEMLAARFLAEVRRQGRPISWVVRDAVREYLKNRKVAGTLRPSAPATAAAAPGGGHDDGHGQS